jgi:DNA-binding IclR family transcriptional regulator
LFALVRAANPLLSFRELSVSTGVPLAQVHKLSAHLAFWGMAAVVDTVRM